MANFDSILNSVFDSEKTYHENSSSIISFTSSSPIKLNNSANDILYRTIVYSITIPLFILTTCGNGIILITIKYQARLLSSNSNYFILSLAFADFFVGIAIMPIMIVYTANRAKWPHRQLLCDFFMAFDFLCSSASFLTLSAMSVERYKMLTTSYIYIRNSSKFRIVVFIALSWSLPLITWIPMIVGYRVFNTTIQEEEKCNVPANKYVILVLSIALYHIPLFCMVTFYTKLIIHIKKSSNNNMDFLHENVSLNSSVCGRNQKEKISNNNSLVLRCNSAANSKTSLKLKNHAQNQKQIKNKETFKILIPCCIPSNSSNNTRPSKSQKSTPNFRSHKTLSNGLNGSLLSTNPNENLNLLIIKNGRKLSLNVDSNHNCHNQRLEYNSKNESVTITQKKTTTLSKNHDKISKKKSNKESLSGSIFAETSPDYQSLRLKRNQKAARMLGFLVAAFSICWLPFTIFYPLGQFYPNLLPDYAMIFVWWLGYVNSTINPFLYVYSNKNIRRSVRILFCQRIWSYFTGSKSSLNHNFRHDSIKNNIAITNQKLLYRKPSIRNVNLIHHI